MSEWNHDITAAPRGKTVHSERKVGDRTHQISDFVPYYIWAATKCGKVLKSYWVPPAGKNAGRWSGFANAETPIAWQHFVVPEHPFAAAKTSEAAQTPAPMNVSLPDTDERSGEGANVGDCPDDFLISTAHPQTQAVEPVSSSTGPLYFEDAGSGQ